MLFCIIIIVLSIVLDQLSKYAVLQNIEMYAEVPVIPKVFHFTYIENKGAAFGMLADNRWVFLVISSVAIIAFIIYMAVVKPKNKLLGISLSLLCGGGIGNMIDRIFRGSVVDFIEVEFIDFYVFNVADMFVCIGCGLLVLYVILEEIKDRRKTKAEIKE